MSTKQLTLLSVPATPAPSWGAQVATLIMRAKIAANKRGQPFTVREMAEIIDAADVDRPLRPKPHRANGHNLLFDALAEGCGLTEPFTKSAAAQVAKAMNEIVAAHPKVTPDDMRATALAVLRKFEGAGPMAVSTHYGAFSSARRQRKPESTSPAGWLDALNKLFPDSVKAKGGAFEIEKETDYEWARLDASVQAAIRKELS